MIAVWRVVACTVALLGLGATASSAQGHVDGGPARRVAFDTVTGLQGFLSAESGWPTQVIVDAFAAVDLGAGWHASARPVVWRVGGEWETLIDQASVRYERRGRTNWRIEAGKFPAPIGLGLTENRANVNAGVLWCHRPYYMPVPSLGADLPRVSLISAVYPVGVHAAASGARWDARAAVVDRAPVEFWRGGAAAARGVNGIVGAGLTPRQGLRFGVAGAWGDYARSAPARPALAYDTMAVEGDWAFGYTRLSGEWIRSRFEAPGGTRTSTGWTAQAQRTLSPRVFAHSRATAMKSPRSPSSLDAVSSTLRYRSVDTTLGYLVTPDVTLRASHAAVRTFTSTKTDHQVGLSIVWARRWW